MLKALTPEDDLLSAARAGEVAALNRLLVAHQNGVYRYGLQVCGTTEDAEDALQETLWAATRFIRQFRGTAASIVSWMFTTIRRECFRLLEGRRKAPSSLDAESAASAAAPDPLDHLAARHRSELLAEALRSLDPVQREVLLLRDIEGLAAPQAADRLGISVQALKSRLHRARTALRDRLAVHAHHF
jgi:RNA polymerase sigma-70 factor (ECF subfamily)